MRTTINIEDDLMLALKREASRSRASLTEVVNRLLRLGVERSHPATRSERYACPTFSMGQPSTPHVDKALQLAATDEDDEVVRELGLRR
jgi:hypothetical protein